MQWNSDGSGGTVTPAWSRATRLGEHDDSGGTPKSAWSRATRLGEHGGSGGTVTPAWSRAGKTTGLEEVTTGHPVSTYERSASGRRVHARPHKPQPAQLKPALQSPLNPPLHQPRSKQHS